MRVKHDRLWVSEATKKKLKILAAREGKTLMELLDEIADRDRKKRGDDYRFF